MDGGFDPAGGAAGAAGLAGSCRVPAGGASQQNQAKLLHQHGSASAPEILQGRKTTATNMNVISWCISWSSVLKCDLERLLVYLVGWLSLHHDIFLRSVRQRCWPIRPRWTTLTSRCTRAVPRRATGGAVNTTSLQRSRVVSTTSGSVCRKASPLRSDNEHRAVSKQFQINVYWRAFSGAFSCITWSSSAVCSAVLTSSKRLSC